MQPERISVKINSSSPSHQYVYVISISKVQALHWQGIKGEITLFVWNETINIVIKLNSNLAWDPKFTEEIISLANKEANRWTFSLRKS